MTIQTKHTPGPWQAIKAQEADNTGGYDYAVVDPCNLILAEAFQNVDHGKNGFKYLSYPAEANARLIAAAPELLAAEIAQEEAEDFYHNHCPDADDHGEEVPELCEHCFPYFDKARCMRRAAIAKATEAA